VFALGDYRSGKTTLLKAIPAAREWVFDPTMAWGVGHRDLRQAEAAFRKTGRGVFQPARGAIKGEDGAFARFCDLALGFSNCMTKADEVNMAKPLPSAFHDLHRLGHKRNIGVAIGAHSIWDIPHELQQFNHLFAFRPMRVVELNALVQIVGPDGVAWLKQAPPYWSAHVSRDHVGPVPPVGRVSPTQNGVPTQKPVGTPKPVATKP
jgi:hypothetical protein